MVYTFIIEQSYSNFSSVQQLLTRDSGACGLPHHSSQQESTMLSNFPEREPDLSTAHNSSADHFLSVASTYDM